MTLRMLGSSAPFPVEPTVVNVPVNDTETEKEEAQDAIYEMSQDIMSYQESFSAQSFGAENAKTTPSAPVKSSENTPSKKRELK